MEKFIVEILKDINDDINFSKDEDLFVKGLMDSFAVVTLVAELEEKFNIEFEAEEIIPENFQSVNSILAIIKKINNKDGEC